MEIDVSNLDEVVEFLTDLEEPIIFSLIRRALYKQNLDTYKPDRNSLLQTRFREQEEIDAPHGRYKVPRERPFSKVIGRDLPPAEKIIKGPGKFLSIKHFNIVNLTSDIYKAYLELIPNICKPGDDNEHGSSTERDIEALRVISERIHFGAFYVAEAKFQKDPELYKGLIASKNAQKIEEVLTRPDIEKKILGRIHDKVTYHQAQIKRSHRFDPIVVNKFYQEHIIPLTKKGEVLYLINRKQ